MLGWGQARFTRTFADVRGAMAKAFEDYIAEVKAGSYPAEEHTYK